MRVGDRERTVYLIGYDPDMADQPNEAELEPAYPHDADEAVDLELMARRLAMTTAERAENHYRARRVLERVKMRIREKYAIDVRFY